MAHLETELVGHILVVTMNRPEAKNALSPEMLVGMADAWDRIDSDPEIRCAILTGAGGVFCAGADLKAMNNAQGESDASRRFKEDAGLAWKALLRHHQLTKPLISAAEAEPIGLIGRVVADGKALETALEIGQRIARNGPLAVQAVKRSVQATEGLPETEALKIELEIGL